MAARSVMGMTNSTTTKVASDGRSGDAVFADPISYLAGLGIVAVVVSDTTLPAAA